MKVLVIGSGGREHALVWKISQSKRVKKIFSAPGNAGMAELSERVNIKIDDVSALLHFAKDNKIDLSVVGPEAPLVKGIVDEFTEHNLKIFGPSRELAMLEGSKVFAKETMKTCGVPTADFKVFDNPGEAKIYAKKMGAPLVVKADGLAAGKGVAVAQTIDEAEKAIDDMMVRRIFGSAGDRVIVEECLEGEEASLLIFTDGKTIVPLESSQDHKRIFDKDKGPNTGGMGAYSPAPIVTKEIFDETLRNVFRPVIDGLRRQTKIYKGVLYAGLMITKSGSQVLEFNARFGDPETQAILPRLDSDLVEIMLACIDGHLDKLNIKWNKKACLCVVCASKGYPGDYEKHKEISGLNDVKKMKDVIVFHAGTAKISDKLVSEGGRVLGVCGLGDGIQKAKDIAYEAVKKIHFEGMQYRKDIGDRAINDK